MYSKEIAERVRGFLEQKEWAFDFDEEEGLFRVGLQLCGKISKCDIFANVRETDILTFTSTSLQVDEDSMEKVAMYLCMANSNIAIGNFEFDRADGEIRYRTFVDCDGGMLPTFEVLDGMFCVPPSMLDKYGEGLMKVLINAATPDEAIADVLMKEEMPPQPKELVDPSMN